MKVKLFTIFLLFLVTTTASGQDSSEENNDYASEKDDQKPEPPSMADMLTNITSVLERLVTSVKNNEKQIEDLKLNILANNSRLSSSIDSLAASLKENKAISEDKLVDLTEKLTANNSRLSNLFERLENTVTKDQKIQEEKFANLAVKIAADNSQLLSSFKDLASIVESNQKATEQKIVNHAQNIFNISELINNLMNPENGSEFMTEGKGIDFKLNIEADNSRLLSSIDDLANSIKSSHKVTEEKIGEQSQNIDSLSRKIDEVQGFVAKTQMTVEEKFQDLKSHIIASNTKIYDKLSQKQKAVDEKMAELQSNISLVVNTTSELIESRLEEEKSPCKAPKIANLTIVCETDSFDGGWIVIQQRVNVWELNFTRNWEAYRNGFGIFAKNESFWLGNEAIHQITRSGQYELALEVKDVYGEYKFARYAEFSVGAEDDKYRLKLGAHSGTLKDFFSKSDSMMFTTYDQDNDNLRGENCGNVYKSGWWFVGFCGNSDLNHNGGPFWSGFANVGSFSRMMIRRK